VEGSLQPNHRCGHPGKQQGRRFPSASSAMSRRIWWARVSVFLTEITQQTHSPRASGVSVFQAAKEAGEAARAETISAGARWAGGRGGFEGMEEV
jgi:hypothetical protein